MEEENNKTDIAASGSDNLPASTKESLIDGVSAAAIFHITGLPPAVQRSLWKAFDRVFMSGAEWPASWLESRAQIMRTRAGIEVARAQADAANIASLQEGRAKVNAATADEAAIRIREEGIAQRAANYHTVQLRREQERREKILYEAADILKKAPPDVDSATEIDEDVLETILREGGQRSTEQFKSFFARLLAGEISRPGSFSISTIRALGGMTQETANLFQLACDLSTVMLLPDDRPTNPKLVTFMDAKVGEGALPQHGLPYDDAYKLIENGLLRSEFNEGFRFRESYVGSVPFTIGSKRYLLTRQQPPEKEIDPNQTLFEWVGLSFTKSGTELRTIVSMKPVPNYVRAGSRFYMVRGFVLHEIVRSVGAQMVLEKVSTD